MDLMIVWPKRPLPGGKGETNVVSTAQSCGNHHFMINNLTLANYE